VVLTSYSPSPFLTPESKINHELDDRSEINVKQTNVAAKDMFEQAHEAFFETSKTSPKPSASSVELPKRQSEPPAQKK
jgi:hypothetical protein